MADRTGAMTPPNDAAICATPEVRYAAGNTTAVSNS